MSQGRSVLVTIFTNVINSLKPRKFRGTLVGKDHFGNEYYQILASQNQKKQRWFEPKEKDNFEQELPAEWESWLRYRRKEPPLEEEVLASAALAKEKKINAIKLEAGRISKKKVNEITSNNTFPVYEEYEKHPGEKNS